MKLTFPSFSHTSVLDFTHFSKSCACFSRILRNSYRLGSCFFGTLAYRIRTVGVAARGEITESLAALAYYNENICDYLAENLSRSDRPKGARNAADVQGGTHDAESIRWTKIGADSLDGCSMRHYFSFWYDRFGPNDGRTGVCYTCRHG